MRAGAGGQVSSVFYETNAAQIDFTVALHSIFNGIAGFGEGGRIQDHYIVLFAFFFQLRQQVKDIGTAEADAILQVIQTRIFLSLGDSEF